LALGKRRTRNTDSESDIMMMIGDSPGPGRADLEFASESKLSSRLTTSTSKLNAAIGDSDSESARESESHDY
jgi:hypothetical protein